MRSALNAEISGLFSQKEGLARYFLPDLLFLCCIFQFTIFIFHASRQAFHPRPGYSSSNRGLL